MPRLVENESNCHRFFLVGGIFLVTFGSQCMTLPGRINIVPKATISDSFPTFLIEGGECRGQNPSSGFVLLKFGPVLHVYLVACQAITWKDYLSSIV